MAGYAQAANGQPGNYRQRQGQHQQHLPAVGLIGLTTFLLSGLGVWIGFRFGSRFQAGAERAGGIILILIGLKILLEHLGLLPF